MRKSHRDKCDVSESIEAQHVDDAETAAVNQMEITERVGDASQENRADTQKLFEFSDDSQTVINDIRVDTRNKIRRIRPPVKAHGGKYYLAREIVPVLLSAPNSTTEYLEPCAFGASVFLAMPRFPREILGDVNPGVVDLWRVLADERLSDVLCERVSSISYERSVFESAKCEIGGTIADRAAVSRQMPLLAWGLRSVIRLVQASARRTPWR